VGGGLFLFLQVIDRMLFVDVVFLHLIRSGETSGLWQKQASHPPPLVLLIPLFPFSIERRAGSPEIVKAGDSQYLLFLFASSSQLWHFEPRGCLLHTIRRLRRKTSPITDPPLTLAPPIRDMAHVGKGDTPQKTTPPRKPQGTFCYGKPISRRFLASFSGEFFPSTRWVYVLTRSVRTPTRVFKPAVV